MPTHSLAQTLGIAAAKIANQAGFAQMLQSTADFLDPAGRKPIPKAPAPPPVPKAPAPAAPPPIPKPPAAAAPTAPAATLPWHKRLGQRLLQSPFMQRALSLDPARDTAAMQAGQAGDPNWWRQRRPGIDASPMSTGSGLFTLGTMGAGALAGLPAKGISRLVFGPEDLLGGAAMGEMLSPQPFGRWQGVVNMLPAGPEVSEAISGSPESYMFDPERFSYETTVPMDPKLQRPGHDAFIGTVGQPGVWANKAWSHPLRTMLNLPFSVANNAWEGLTAKEMFPEGGPLFRWDFEGRQNEQ